MHATEESKHPRVKMILVAERLFASHGIEGVSLRKIGLDAGQRFKSAPQHYFGDRDNLVAAVLAFRQEGINGSRQAMLTELERTGNEHDVRSLMGALVRPLAELIGTDAEPYLGFLASLARYRPPNGSGSGMESHHESDERGFVLDPGRRHTAGAIRVTELLREALCELDATDLHNRIALLEVMVIYGLSQVPRLMSDSPLPPDRSIPSFIDALIEALTLVLTGGSAVTAKG